AERVMRVCRSRLRCDRRAQSDYGTVQLPLVPVDHTERVIGLCSRFYRKSALQLVDGLREPIGAFEHERQVVPGEGMARGELQHVTKALERFGHILFRLRETQGEIAVRIVRSHGNDGSGALDGFLSFSRL